MNPIIDEIYETKIVRDSSGNEYALSSEIDSTEGDFLYRLISSDKSIMKTLEVGCAYGLSSLHICEALRNRSSPSSEIDSTEGDFLYRLISSDKSIMKTLEVGCAYGLSSLHICEALRNRSSP